MYRKQIVLELLVLYVGMSHSWDLAVAHRDLLEFYTNEIKTNTISFNSFLGALAYDEVHDMLLFVDKQSNDDAICGYDITLNTYQYFLQRNGKNIHGLAFDPVTELLFFSDTNEKSISWISIKPGNLASNNANLLIKLDDGIPTDIAVDSCTGYVYWITTNLPTPKIERVRFDGSEREVILTLNSVYTNSYYKLEPHSLVIDQGTQKMHWMEPTTNISNYIIYYADLNGENKIATTTAELHHYKFANPSCTRLTVSETHLYISSWCSDCDIIILKFGKEIYSGGKKQIDIHVRNENVSIVAKHQMRIQDIKNCKALTCLEGKSSVEPYCVHGEKVIGQSVCICAPGYIGKRCDVPVCGNYCLQGNCSINDKGLPKCRCDTGYSGERCEIAACHGFCLNNGVCSLNEEDEPSCECVGGYQGSRCEVSRTQ